jgi:membrane fusion protein (multidrug efflux system)
MSKKLTWVIILAGVGVIFIFVKMKVLSPPSAASKPAAGKKQVMNLQAIIAQPRTFENTLRVNGTILPNEQVSLQPETSGKVTGIYFKEGGKVHRGDLLLKINDADLQANLQKLKSQQKLDESNEQRQQQMLNIQGISQQEYETATNQLNTTKADIAYNEAQVQKTEVRAPFDGTVGLRYVSVGDFISNNSQITSLVSTSQLKIEFSIPEQYASLVHNGDEITFVPQGSNNTFHAKVYAVDPMLNQQTRSLSMRALFDNSKGEVIPGQFAAVLLTLQKIENAILLPSQTIVPDIAGQKIYVIDSGRVHPSRITVGARTDSAVQVLTGVETGDTVLLNGLQFVTPGLQVKVSVVK